MYLPDTNIFIYGLLNKDPYAALLRRWYKNHELAISTVTVAEYLVKAVPKDKQSFEEMVSYIKLFPIDLTIAKEAASYRERFLRKTKRVYLLDCFLAATAKVHDLTLVTVNKDDFPMKDIKIVDPQKR